MCFSKVHEALLLRSMVWNIIFWQNQAIDILGFHFRMRLGMKRFRVRIEDLEMRRFAGGVIRLIGFNKSKATSLLVSRFVILSLLKDSKILYLIVVAQYHSPSTTRLPNCKRQPF